MRLNRKLFLTIVLSMAIVIMVGSNIDAKKYRLRKPWIGVYSQTIDADLMEAFDLDRNEGIVVVDVIDDSPADDAGLRRRDVIIRFNNEAVVGKNDLLELVRETDIGDEVEVIVLRRGQERTLFVEVGDKDDYEDNNNYYAPNVGSTYRLFNHQVRPHSYIGVGIQNLNDQLGEYFGVDGGAGVLVTGVFEDSPAEDAGLKAGDVVISADGGEVYQTSDLIEIIADKEEGDQLTLTILRRGDKRKITVEVGEDIYGAEKFGLNNLTIPNMRFSVPDLRGLGNSYFLDNDDDAYFDRKEYQKGMEKLQKEMMELKKQLQQIKKKLE